MNPTPPPNDRVGFWEFIWNYVDFWKWFFLANILAMALLASR